MKKNHNQFCKNALYFFLSALLCAGSATESKSQSLSSGLSVNKTLKVHFKKPSGWGHVKLFYWNAQPVKSLPTIIWPGIELKTDAALGKDWYSLNLDAATCFSLVFNDGGSMKTPDLSLCGEGFYDNGWMVLKKPPVLTMLPAAGYYKKTITVLLETQDKATPAPLIYYTLDKSKPDKTAKLYNPQKPFTLSESTLVSAIAFDASGVASEVLQQLYTIEVDKKAPVLIVSPPGGKFLIGVHVSLSAIDNQDSVPRIFYTRNGQDPVPGSNATELIIKGKIWFGLDTKDSILKVIARDDQMNTTPVQTFRFKFYPTGSSEINSDCKIKVFPNPASDFIQVEVSDPANITMTYSVKDVLGQEMISGALGSSGLGSRLETSQWPEGFYMLNISDGHNFFVQKISIRH